MGTHIVYLGPDGIGEELAETGQFARRGEPIEVETELAERLLEQEGKWARATTKAAKVAKRTAAPNTTEER